MVGVSQGGANMDPGDVINENMNSLSVPELIASLKSAFQNKYFSEVEATLVAREEKLTCEIEAKVKAIDLLKKKNELLEERCAIETFAKLRAEKELEECRRDCFKLKESNSRLTEEQNEFNDVLTGIAEDKKIIIELERKNCELECAKLRAETEIQVYKKKFEELETHVVRLEKDLMALNHVEPLGSTGDRVSGDILRDKCFTGDQKSCEKDNNVGKNAGPSFCPSKNVDIIMDTAATEEKRVGRNAEVESRIHVEGKSEKIVIDDSEPNEGPGSSNRTDTYRGTGRHLSEIVEIDSDDNSAPPEISTVREMATPVSVHNVHSRQAVIKNCTEEVLKRKRESCQKRELLLDEGGSSSSSSSDSEDELDLSVDYLSMIRSFQQGHVDRADKKWETESQMIDEFCKNGELCMEAVCALYRQQMQTSARKSFSGSSTFQNHSFNKLAGTRCITLAEFLIDGDPQGKLKKSKEELMAHDPEGFDDCLRIAAEHSHQLFEMYQRQEEPLFLN